MRGGFLVLPSEGPAVAKAPPPPLPNAACFALALGRVWGDREALPFISFQTGHFWTEKWGFWTGFAVVVC